ncbi:NADH dehydrogenase [ubiquinone] 1 alpha subcomplex subunit 2 [Zostera marina]|uniref:NADH dehydrogenase [ubiquinone] 1 alpha subcomplex subunit 2 n=1 Tax=Zostera marina TaxID=29655 RepID=A0A0K9Q2X1_ZOSMR|nr:NADH dehydrogenase [ubiquinone] 1 alpha subcomplex subunit 2 [Zostera marina]
MSWRGNLSRNLKELRFLFCQTSPTSAQTRHLSLFLYNFNGFGLFVLKNYKDLKTMNPKLPILIRECSGVDPQLWARYDMGVERYVRLDGLTESEINKILEDLIKSGTSTNA